MYYTGGSINIKSQRCFMENAEKLSYLEAVPLNIFHICLPLFLERKKQFLSSLTRKDSDLTNSCYGNG